MTVKQDLIRDIERATREIAKAKSRLRDLQSQLASYDLQIETVLQMEQEARDLRNAAFKNATSGINEMEKSRQILENSRILRAQCVHRLKMIKFEKDYIAEMIAFLNNRQCNLNALTPAQGSLSQGQGRTEPALAKPCNTVTMNGKPHPQLTQAMRNAMEKYNG